MPRVAKFTPETEVMVYYTKAYVPARHAGDKHRNTRSTYEADIRTLARIVREMDEADGEPVRKLTLGILSDDLIKAAMAWRVDRDKVSVGAANKIYRHLRAIWAFAARPSKNLLAVGPSKEEKPYKELMKEPICWSQEEFFAILAAAKRYPGFIGSVKASDFCEALVWFVYSTGARITACMYTPTANFDVLHSTVLVPAAYQKQGADQLLDLLDEAREALLKLKAKERGLVHLFDDWPYDRNNEHWKALNLLLRRLLVSAGLFDKVKEVTRYDLWHKLRRTFATYVTAEGGEALAMMLLGHSHIRVTRRYVDKRFVSRPTAKGLLPVPPSDPAATPPVTIPAELGERPRLSLYRGEAV